MLQWFTADPLLAMLYILAIPATVILILQTIMLLFGMGGEDGELESDVSGLGDADAGDLADDLPDDADIESEGGFDGDTGLRLFTVRGMVAFFSVGGWAGIAAHKLGAHPLLTAAIALAMGTAALFTVAMFFKLIPRIRHNGTMKLSNAVGSVGEVYITIPAKGEGSGKVNVILQSQLSELTAVTYADRPLKYGEKIRVTGTIGENTLIVEPVSQPAGKNA